MNFTHAALLSLLSLGSLPTMIGCAAETPAEEPVATTDDEIVGGFEARPGAWPGTAALYIGSQQACGGTLVHESWVLTAGHCVAPWHPTGGISKVVLGRHKLTSSTTGETVLVDKVIRHEGYGGDLDNDIALLHLATPATSPTATILAPTQNGATTYSRVTVVGWGAIAEGGRSSDVLKQVTVPVMSQERCRSFDGYETVTENMICAGVTRGGKDSCQGDSGGPLFQTIDGKPTQVGVVSWGIGCAREKAPGVYTRLGNYLAWMNEKTDGAVGAPPAAAAAAE